MPKREKEAAFQEPVNPLVTFISICGKIILQYDNIVSVRDRQMKRERKNRKENTIDRAFKGILYPNEEQKALIEKTLGCCRYVFNRFLNERIQSYIEEGKDLSYVEQCRKLTLLKADPETEWLREVDATALQNSIRALQDGYDSYWQSLKKGQKKGRPRFKKKHQSRQSYRSTNNHNSIRIESNRRIRLPKLGGVKCRFPRVPEGRILNATIKREPDGTYAVTLICEEPRPEPLPKTGKNAGIDLGVKTLAVTSDGTEYDNPKTYDRNQKKLARAQRKLSRKTKDSRNREKQRVLVAKIHTKIHNQRLDAIHKMTHDLVTRYDVICMEDLDGKELMESKIAREVSDASFGEIKRQLGYKTDWYGKQLVTVDRWYPSSQTCSECGQINRNVKDLTIRKWKCPICGTFHDRDLNAAKNILKEGLRKLES